ncbi:MAG: hypothetical protein Q4E02_05790 [Lagierella massiliensis]|nr:hypothetical protein [Lagierella massiliensis]
MKGKVRKINTKIFWNWSKEDNVLYIDGVIAEESWFDDDITPRLFLMT